MRYVYKHEDWERSEEGMIPEEKITHTADIV
jgi:hypothetical protein